MVVYVTEKGEIEWERINGKTKSKKRFRFANVGERRLCHRMSMGNNLVCFHSHTLFWSVWNGCQPSGTTSSVQRIANLDFSFSQRALNKAEGCCVAQGNTRNTGCLSWLVSKGVNRFHFFQRTHSAHPNTHTESLKQCQTYVNIHLASKTLHQHQQVLDTVCKACNGQKYQMNFHRGMSLPTNLSRDSKK